MNIHIGGRLFWLSENAFGKRLPVTKFGDGEYLWVTLKGQGFEPSRGELIYVYESSDWDHHPDFESRKFRDIEVCSDGDHYCVVVNGNVVARFKRMSPMKHEQAWDVLTHNSLIDYMYIRSLDGKNLTPIF